LLAADFRIFGAYTFAAFLAAAWSNVVFSTATVLPIYFAGLRIGGPVVAAIAAGLWAIFPNSIVLRERERYAESGEMAYMREKHREAVDFIIRHPGEDARRYRRRFIAFWSGGTKNPLTDFMHSESGWFRWVVAFNIFGGVGAIAGMLTLALKRNPMLWPLAAYAILLPIPYYVTLAVPRYRLPADPAILLLSAVPLSVVCRKLAERFGDRPQSHRAGGSALRLNAD
jgi:hypothetical protein